MALPIIQIDNLSKRYRLGAIGATSLRDTAARWFERRRGRAKDDYFWALRDVSLSIAPGEIVGVIGRNGAGKSTLLKILSRITEPTSGRAVLRGRVVSLLEVGTGFHPDLTGRENVFLNGAILGMSKAEIRGKLEEIVAFAQLEKFIDTPVKRYSSGMYVRLAFAVAAHLEPEVLIIDEVLAVGDSAFQRKCIGKMESVSRTEGRTILFVSHDLSVVANLCRRVVYLKDGRVAADGFPQDVIPLYTAATSVLTGSIDLTTPATTRRGDLRARFTRASLLGADGAIIPVAVEGEDFMLELTVEVREPLELDTLDFNLVDAFNNDLFTGKLFDAIQPRNLSPGRYRFRALFSPNFLGRGSYLVRLSCFGPHFHEYDHIHHAFSFLVGQSPDEKPGFSPRTGPVRCPLSWTMSRDALD